MIPIEVRRLQDILSSFLGAPKNDITESYQLQFSCPHCIETKGDGEKEKHNLEVNIAKGVFKCWSCAAEGDNMQGSIKKLILKYGSPSIMEEYKTVLQELLESKLYQLGDFQNVFNENQFERLYLPKTFTKIADINNLRDYKLKQYLEKRRITQEIIDRYNIGYTTWDEESFADKQRIIIPSYDSFGELNYWVGRDYSGYDKKTKYKNCKADKERILFQESIINWDAPIVLVEGAIDCLYYYNSISLLGKILSKESKTYQLIQEKANADIYICLDADTKIEETKRIYQLLNRGRLKNKIHYIRLGEANLPYKDFGEIYEDKGKKGIIKAFQNAKQFSEVELIF